MRDLTESMKFTLMQIGWGVTGTTKGWRDSADSNVNKHSIKALCAKGLVDVYPSFTASLATLNLTRDGWELWEELYDSDDTGTGPIRQQVKSGCNTQGA